ncbi:hypothetical protein MYX84_13085, partial [Acidobacteria bacterium AH-259-O06]|nr:hypothetical protein [Acidobacteria bacterium AH-259-O06]
ERQRDRPPDPQPWRVAAGRPCFLCRASSTMLTGIACVVASRNQGRRARHKHHRIYGLEHLAPKPAWLPNIKAIIG